MYVYDYLFRYDAHKGSEAFALKELRQFQEMVLQSQRKTHLFQGDLINNEPVVCQVCTFSTYDAIVSYTCC